MSKKAPSLMDMMKNFTTDVVAYAKEGAPHVTKSQYNERLRICGVCPHLKKENMRCGQCGCVVEHKAKWATTTCPDDRWDPVKLKAAAAKKIKLKKNASGTRKDNNTKASN
jgi:hypothetical protein